MAFYHSYSLDDHSPFNEFTSTAFHNSLRRCHGVGFLAVYCSIPEITNSYHNLTI